MGKRPSARVIAVGGGKGGVGKSIIASNLAIAMAQAGNRVILVDADLGAANLHTLFGVDGPRTSIQTLLEHEVDTLEAATTPTAVRNLRLVAGMGAVPGAANINHAQKQKVLRHIRSLDADVVVVDVGAGVSYNVLDFFDLARLRLVVMTPQLTSVQNAYSFTKAAVLRALRHAASDPGEVSLLEASTSTRETARVEALLAKVRAESPAFATRLEKVLSGFGAQIVGNQVFEAKDAGIFHAISRMMGDFLSIRAPVLGHVRASRRVHDSVTRRRPLLVDDPGDECARAFHRMAEALLLAEVDEPMRPAVAVAGERDGARPDDGQTDEELPAEPGLYMRRHERHPVSWTARLEGPGGGAYVQVREVSLGGAGIEANEPLPVAVGDERTLVFDDLPDRPALPGVVRYVNARHSRVGLEFLCEGELPARIVADARH
ncbi:MAG: P-loop NTPase [Deltaproteobacteria bacterium]|nr:P-loop NTPase [Deltaproteobacteria bacterium]